MKGQMNHPNPETQLSHQHDSKAALPFSTQTLGGIRVSTLRHDPGREAHSIPAAPVLPENGRGSCRPRRRPPGPGARGRATVRGRPSALPSVRRTRTSQFLGAVSKMKTEPLREAMQVWSECSHLPKSSLLKTNGQGDGITRCGLGSD